MRRDEAAALLAVTVLATALAGCAGSVAPAWTFNPEPPATAPFACRTRFTPDQPGPVDQARPIGLSDLAFDRRAGRLVAVVGAETWTFDVCTNTWTQMHPARVPSSLGWSQLVYDIDSDATILVSMSEATQQVWAYDLQADTWTHKRAAPTDVGFVAYNPVSGHVVAGSWVAAALWEYDVETDTWTQIRLANVPYGYGPFAYDASADRMVMYAEEPAGAETWLLDLRTTTWSESGAEAPVVEPGWSAPGIVYDESAERTLVMGSSGLAAYDAAADRWEVVAGPGEWYTNTTVYDPVNGRLVGLGWRGDIVAFDLETRQWTVLLEPEEG